jgi:hypothetical protein
MIPELDALRSDVIPWLALWRLVEQTIQDTPPDSWRPTLEYRTPEERSDSAHIQRSLMAHLQQHAPSVMSAVLHRHSTDTWPELAPPTIYYLRHMHGRLLNFLQGIVLRPHDKPRTIFPYPRQDGNYIHPKDALLWFLTEWWIEAGSQEMIYELSHRHEPPPFSFSTN